MRREALVLYLDELPEIVGNLGSELLGLVIV